MNAAALLPSVLLLQFAVFAQLPQLFAPDPSLPADPQLCGTRLWAQGIVVDVGASHGIAFTRGLDATLGCWRGRRGTRSRASTAVAARLHGLGIGAVPEDDRRRTTPPPGRMIYA